MRLNYIIQFIEKIYYYITLFTNKFIGIASSGSVGLDNWIHWNLEIWNHNLDNLIRLDNLEF